MSKSPLPFETRPLPADFDVLAPDTTEIRLLLANGRGSMCHGTLGPGMVSVPVRHRTVEEIWYVLHGEADLWRKQGKREEIVRIRPGISLTIPLGASFQFRTIGEEAFRFLMVTMPPWPGDEECEVVEGQWPVAGFP